MPKLPLPNIKNIVVEGQTVVLADYLSRDFSDIREASETLPSILGFLGQARARALADTMSAKRMLAQAKATVYFALRNGEFEAKGYGGKPTEEALKHAIALDETVIAAAEYHEKMIRFFGVLDSSVDSMVAKMDLVRSSEATKRVTEIDEKPTMTGDTD
jgi:hypothetical protein